jgi:hypothetical protein
MVSIIKHSGPNPSVFVDEYDIDSRRGRGQGEGFIG